MPPACWSSNSSERGARGIEYEAVVCEEPAEGGDVSRLFCITGFWNDVVSEFDAAPNTDPEQTII